MDEKHKVWKLRLVDGQTCTQVIPEGVTEGEMGELVFRLFIGHRVAAYWAHEVKDEILRGTAPAG